jgi:glucosamine-6-phosphate deaminase
MEVIILATPQEVIAAGAEIVEAQVRAHPYSVLGLATGGTMEGIYTLLAQRNLDFSHVTTFNLDEYVGLDADDPGSYASYMREHLFDHVNLSRDSCHLLDGTTKDIPAHCAAYERAIVDCGGIDLQLLGIGQDGHIAFNEPGSSLSSRTRLKTLTPDTRENNAPHFPKGESVPMHVLTMGIATIMEARRCLLLAYGKGKSPAVAGAVEGPITASCPASILQMHPRCTMIIDEAAAVDLVRGDYYKFVYQNKPSSGKS